MQPCVSAIVAVDTHILIACDGHLIAVDGTCCPTVDIPIGMEIEGVAVEGYINFLGILHHAIVKLENHRLRGDTCGKLGNRLGHLFEAHVPVDAIPAIVFTLVKVHITDGI